MEQLFKAFSKVHEHETLNPEGLGMGLLICQQIVESSGGSISVLSEGPSKGCTFKFNMVMDLPSETLPTPASPVHVQKTRQYLDE